MSVSRPLAVSIRILTPASVGVGAHRLADVEAAHARHHRRRAARGRAARARIASSASSPSRATQHLVALALHQELERDHDVRLVVGDQDLVRSWLVSLLVVAPQRQSKPKQAPCPGSDRSHMRPPKCSTIWRLIGRPRPVPCGRLQRVAALAELLEHELLLARPARRARCRAPRRVAPSPSARSRTSTRPPLGAARTSRRSTAGSAAPAVSRSGSARSGGTCSGICELDRGAALAEQLGRASARPASTSARRSTSALCHSAWPDSILAMSSTWLTSRRQPLGLGDDDAEELLRAAPRPSPGRRASARRRRGSRSAACAARGSPTT